MCNNGGIARDGIFLSKAECHMFFRKKSWQIVWKIEQIQQIQRKCQWWRGDGEYGNSLWQLAAMDQNMEEAAYCMEMGNGQVQKCTVVRKSDVFCPVRGTGTNV